MKVLSRRHLRWVAVGAAAMLVARRFHRRRPPKIDPQASSLTRMGVRPDRESGEILTLAHYLVGTRDPDSDEGREACLRRAAEIVLETRKDVPRFVAAHREAFLRACRIRHSSA